ncbi:MAG: glycosyl hydrolase [Stenomitos rutilans HA7619-LM2]|nr:glycosyl hydrolase [Stenomitos rutilans HA7619-LM2]
MGGCRHDTQSQAQTTPSPVPTTEASIASIAPPLTLIDPALLKQSWKAYRQRFIQADGRVIDWEAEARSTSEGQAYAMLRSVFIDDPKTFALTLTWAEKNLKRGDPPADMLWAWKWGRYGQKRWGILDRNFASDADVDAITALILASRRWQRPDYLRLAQTKLRDLWALAIVPVGDQRYLLPGPREAFQPPNKLVLNPSYFSPVAFRLFAQVDRAHDWLSLINSGYAVLENSASLSTLKLPSDWLALDTETKQFQALLGTEPVYSRYGFDAYRVWWRVALDANWYREPRAKRYLQEHLGALQQLWRSQPKIPAQIDLRGTPTATYEATSQYGALYAAFRLIDPPMAEDLYQKKILPQYRNGFWDHNSAYYTQNLVWFGLAPATVLSPQLLQPANVTPQPHP